jgi:hypothetical protein
MAYTIHTLAGAQPIAVNSTTQNHPLGTIVRGVDPTYGEGEFIYLQGLAGVTVGSPVQYSANYLVAAHVTTLDKPVPVAFAMAATVASQYGWFQIGGQAVAKKANTVSYAAGAAVTCNGLTAGVIAPSSSLILIGALVAVVASAKSDVTTVRLMINRPHGPGGV